MRVSLHLPHARLSVLEGLGGSDDGGPEIFDISSVLRPDVLVLSLPRVMLPYRALGVSGLLGSGTAIEGVFPASSPSGWCVVASGSRIPEAD